MNALRNHLLIVLFGVSVSIIYAQDGWEWVPIGAEWSYKGIPIFGPNTYEFTTTVVGDTLIEGKNCKIFEVGYGDRDCHDDGLHFMYYEEGRIFWFYNGSFEVLHDFNLSIGDTLDWNFLNFDCSGDFPQFDELFFVIVNVEIQMLGNREYRLQELTLTPRACCFGIYQSHELLISTGALIPAFHIDADIVYLRCYSDQNLTLSVSTGTYSTEIQETDTCFVVTALEEFVNQERISVFPNPVADELRIETKEAMKELILMDIKGQMVKHLYGDDVRSMGSMNISDLENGIYFLMLMDSHGIQYGYSRVVVQH